MRKRGARASGLRARSKSAKTRRTGFTSGPSSYKPAYRYPTKTIVPYSQTAVLKYHDIITLDPGVLTPVRYTFRANGLYDPDLSGVGHQPRGFDQFMGLYQRFCVTASSIMVVANQNTTSSNSALFYISCFPSNTSTPTVSNIYDIMEQPKNKVTWYSGNSSMGATSGAQPYVTNYVNNGLYLGKDDPTNDDTSCGDVGTDPSDGVFWIIYSGCTSATANPSAGDYAITITYYVVLQRPTNTLAS